MGFFQQDGRHCGCYRETRIDKTIDFYNPKRSKHSMSVHKNRPAFLIYNLKQARQVRAICLNETCELVSPPGAARYAGPRFFIQLLSELIRNEKSMKVNMWIDCGDDPGVAMAAIRDGSKNIILSGRDQKLIANMATKANVTLINAIPAAIDCQHVDDIRAEYVKWIDGAK